MYEELEEALHVHFQNPALLTMALTHRSYIYEPPGMNEHSNERLEFLGDSILQFISTNFLYHAFSYLNEGDMSNVRTALIREETLADFARELHLNSFLRLGRGDQTSATSQRVLASTFEAVLGAIYLDQGLEVVEHVLLPRLEPIARHIVSKRLFKDNKSLLQEFAQAHDGITPSYRIVSQEGPSHNREFTAEVLLGEQIVGRGHGRNKQTAEQDAARAALISRGWLE